MSSEGCCSVDGEGDIEDVGDNERMVEINDIDGRRLTCGFRKRWAVGIADCNTGAGRDLIAVGGSVCLRRRNVEYQIFFEVEESKSFVGRL